MKTMFALIAAAAFCLQLASCGGSSAASPTVERPNPAQQSSFSILPPDEVAGSRDVSKVSGALCILTGASRARLEQLLQPYGGQISSLEYGRAYVNLPDGVDLGAAAKELTKQFAITSAQPVGLIHTTRPVYDLPTLRAPSYTPFVPYYADLTAGFQFDGTNVSIVNGFIGQAQPMNIMGFNAAWDVSLTPAIAVEPVSIAIIDAGFWDFTVLDIPGLPDETVIDAANSGFVAGDGTFTAGVPAAAWDLFDDDADANTPDVPYRWTGNLLLGALAASDQFYYPRAFDLNGDTVTTPDEVWNEGMMGVNPNASYILIKTGAIAGNSWAFSDNDIAESIDHAVAAGANIVLLGMFGTGAVGTNVSASIQNARDNNVLVIAPAGDVVDSFDGTTFSSAPVDIRSTSVTPASDPNCVSVAATGFNRIGALGDVDFGGGPIANDGVGWSPRFNPPFDSAYMDVASFSNWNATVAAVGFGIGFSSRPFLQSGDVPPEILPGFNYGFTVDRFGTALASAYVAGAASQIFQILSNVNGTPPTDDEVLSELLSTVQFSGMTNMWGTDGTDGGLLNAGFAAASALNGGNILNTLPAMQFTQLQFSQPFAAVTRGTDLSITATIANGTAPFTLEVDWGDGNPPTVVDPWTNNDPVTLTGGYDALGLRGITVTVTDSNALTASVGVEVSVINPLSCNISISDALGLAVLPTAVISATNYRFSANATNVYTGEIGGTPNTTTFNWNFDADAAYEATGPNPTFAFPTTGSFTITLDVAEDVRPDSSFTLDVTVIPPS